jgi:hypothetical protein
MTQNDLTVTKQCAQCIPVPGTRCSRYTLCSRQRMSSRHRMCLSLRMASRHRICSNHRICSSRWMCLIHRIFSKHKTCYCPTWAVPAPCELGPAAPPLVSMAASEGSTEHAIVLPGRYRHPVNCDLLHQHSYPWQLQRLTRMCSKHRACYCPTWAVPALGGADF